MFLWVSVISFINSAVIPASFFGMNFQSSAKSTPSVVHYKAIQAVPCSTASNHLLKRHNHQPAQRVIPDAFAAEEKCATKHIRVGQQDSILATEIWRKWEIHSSGTVHDNVSICRCTYIKQLFKGNWSFLNFPGMHHVLKDFQQRLCAGQAPADAQRGAEVPLQPVQQGVQETGPPQWPSPHPQGCFRISFLLLTFIMGF